MDQLQALFIAPLGVVRDEQLWADRGLSSGTRDGVEQASYAGPASSVELGTVSGGQSELGKEPGQLRRRRRTGTPADGVRQVIGTQPYDVTMP
jgi:hypothetical protein